MGKAISIFQAILGAGYTQDSASSAPKKGNVCPAKY